MRCAVDSHVFPEKAGRGHEVFAHDLFVEGLRPDGSNCAPGERGEVTLTCGRNPFLAPVRFVAADGSRVNSIDVTLALQPFSLPQFTLHQSADGPRCCGCAPGTPTARGCAPLSREGGILLQDTSDPPQECFL